MKNQMMLYKDGSTTLEVAKENAARYGATVTQLEERDEFIVVEVDLPYENVFQVLADYWSTQKPDETRLISIVEELYESRPIAKESRGYVRSSLDAINCVSSKDTMTRIIFTCLVVGFDEGGIKFEMEAK